MAGKLMDSVDRSPAAAGAREINVLMREVVREVRDAKALDKEADALTFVLDRIHEDGRLEFPPVVRRLLRDRGRGRRGDESEGKRNQRPGTHGSLRELGRARTGRGPGLSTGRTA